MKASSIRLILLTALAMGTTGGCTTDPKPPAPETAVQEAETSPKPKTSDEIRVHEPLLRGMEGLFGQGIWLSTAQRQRYAQEACDVGDSLGCEAKEWSELKPGQAFAVARGTLEALCDQKHWIACLTLGWSLTQLPLQPGSPDPESVGFGAGKEIFAELCASGRQRACDERIRIQVAEGTITQEQGLQALCRQCVEGGFGCLLCIAEKVRAGRVESTRGEWLQQTRALCDGGDPRACELLGDLIESGVGSIPNEERASDVWNEACNEGAMGACVKTARWLARAGANEDRLGVAASLLSRACSGGEPSGCRELGIYTVRTARSERDKAKAVAYFELACASDDQAACIHLAWSLWQGRGAPIQRNRAQNLLSRACSGGEAMACSYQGAMVREDNPTEPSAYLPFFQKACEQKVASACQQLGVEGRRFERWEEAAAGFSAGCLLEDNASCEALSTLIGSKELQLGGGSKTQAVGVLQRMCAQGIPSACMKQSKE